MSSDSSPSTALALSAALALMATARAGQRRHSEAATLAHAAVVITPSSARGYSQVRLPQCLLSACSVPSELSSELSAECQRGRVGTALYGPHLPTSPHISPHLPTSPHIFPQLRTHPHTSPWQLGTALYELHDAEEVAERNRQWRKKTARHGAGKGGRRSGGTGGGGVGGEGGGAAGGGGGGDWSSWASGSSWVAWAGFASDEAASDEAKAARRRLRRRDLAIATCTEAVRPASRRHS